MGCMVCVPLKEAVGVRGLAFCLGQYLAVLWKHELRERRSELTLAMTRQTESNNTSQVIVVLDQRLVQLQQQVMSLLREVERSVCVSQPWCWIWRIRPTRGVVCDQLLNAVFATAIASLVSATPMSLTCPRTWFVAGSVRETGYR